MLDYKLKKYLENSGVKNIDNVASVHAIGVYYETDSVGNQISEIKAIQRRIRRFEDLEPEYDCFFLEYHKVLVIFNNGYYITWDFEPHKWERIEINL